MMTVLLIAGGVILLSTAVLGFMAWHAPEGYEDALGFHFGEPPATEHEEIREREEV